MTTATKLREALHQAVEILRSDSENSVKDATAVLAGALLEASLAAATNPVGEVNAHIRTLIDRGVIYQDEIKNAKIKVQTQPDKTEWVALLDNSQQARLTDLTFLRSYVGVILEALRKYEEYWRLCDRDPMRRPEGHDHLAEPDRGRANLERRPWDFEEDYRRMVIERDIGYIRLQLDTLIDTLTRHSDEPGERKGSFAIGEALVFLNIARLESDFVAGDIREKLDSYRYAWEASSLEALSEELRSFLNPEGADHTYFQDSFEAENRATEVIRRVSESLRTPWTYREHLEAKEHSEK